MLYTEMGLSKPMKPMNLHSRSLFPVRNLFVASIVLAALGLLSACGGGSGSGNPSDPPPAALTISTSSLPTGQVNVAYNAVLAATGGRSAVYVDPHQRHVSGRSHVERGHRRDHRNAYAGCYEHSAHISSG